MPRLAPGRLVSASESCQVQGSSAEKPKLKVQRACKKQAPASAQPATGSTAKPSAGSGSAGRGPSLLQQKPQQVPGSFAEAASPTALGRFKLGKRLWSGAGHGWTRGYTARGRKEGWEYILNPDLGRVAKVRAGCALASP